MANQDSKNALNEIKPFIRDRIRKAKNLSILAGAGTSECCNLPMGRDLIDDLKKAFENDTSTKYLNTTKQFIVNNQTEILKLKTKEADNDIEKYLSRIQAHIEYNKAEDEASQTTKIFIEFHSKILLDISSAVASYSIDSDKSHRQFISKLISSRQDTSKNGRLKIFTTNYDTIFEDVATENGTVVIDGFSFTGKKRIFDSNYFDYDIIDGALTKRNNTTERIDNMCYLYKMHGSINWIQENDKIISTYNEIKDKEPLIIVPGNNKYQSSYNSPYLDMISRFRDNLLETDMLIIIGYSFNDTHINNIIAEIGKRNQRLHLLICKNTPKEPSIYGIDLDDITPSKELSTAIQSVDCLRNFHNRLYAISCDKIFNVFANTILDFSQYRERRDNNEINNKINKTNNIDDKSL